jgi:hypothetical protein
MKDADCGLSVADLELFQAKHLGEAMELAWQWKNLPICEERFELGDEILEMIVNCYQLAMMADATLENPQSTFDSPKPVEHQLYCLQK